MKNYSINNNSRELTYFILAIISVICIYSLSKIPDSEIKDYLLPSGVMVFSLIVLLYDKWLWRLNFISKIPVISGNYSGEISRKTDNGSIETSEVKLKIIQTWSKMVLISEGENSKSISSAVHLKMQDKTTFELKWIYYAKNRFGLEEENRYGEGVTELTSVLQEDGIKLEGFFYSNKLRTGSYKICKIN